MSQMSSLPFTNPLILSPSKDDPSVFPRECKAEFLAALAASGNVRSASARVGVSHQTVYRARLASSGFRRAWDAALLAARAQAEEVLANRAIDGWEEDVLYHGEVVATRQRYSDRLLLAHLARLDKLCGDAEVAQFAGSFDLALARYAAGEDRPALVVEPEDVAAAGEDDISSFEQWSMRSTAGEALRQAQGEREELPPPLPEVRERGEVLGEAAQLDVGLYDRWWDEEGERWLTSWPAPEHFAGEELAVEEDSGEVVGPWPESDEDALDPQVSWARTLTAEEQAGLDAAEERTEAHRAARLALYQRAAFGLASAAEVASIAAANDGDPRWAGPGGAA